MVEGEEQEAGEALALAATTTAPMAALPRPATRLAVAAAAQEEHRRSAATATS